MTLPLDRRQPQGALFEAGEPFLAPARISLDLFTARFPPPRYVGFLGVVAHDGLPLLYELHRRDLQPLLVLASPAEALFGALDVLSGSFLAGSAPWHVGMYWITAREPGAWYVVRRERRTPWLTASPLRWARRYGQPDSYIRGWGAPGTAVAEEIVLQLAGLVEQRALGRHTDGAHLLLVEDLVGAWQGWRSEARQALEYLLAWGGRHGVGVVAGLRYAALDRLPPRVFERFGWRAWGALRGRPTDLLAWGGPGAELVRLAADAFWMHTSSDGWLKFYLPQRDMEGRDAGGYVVV